MSQQCGKWWGTRQKDSIKQQWGLRTTAPGMRDSTEPRSRHKDTLRSLHAQTWCLLQAELCSTHLCLALQAYNNMELLKSNITDVTISHCSTSKPNLPIKATWSLEGPGWDGSSANPHLAFPASAHRASQINTSQLRASLDTLLSGWLVGSPVSQAILSPSPPLSLHHLLWVFTHLCSSCTNSKAGGW